MSGVNDQNRDFHQPALIAVGRLDGAMRHGLDDAGEMFAGWVLRQMLISALRREGHEFTEMRFHAWFAGLSTLSDVPHRSARPPRVMTTAILGQLTQSSWNALAHLAHRLRDALLAPFDHGADDAHRDVLSVISNAATLVANCQTAPTSSVCKTLEILYRLIGENVELAPQERTVHLSAPPAPLWALDMLFGEPLRRQGILSLAVPMPMLLLANSNPHSRLQALADVSESLLMGLQAARQRQRHFRTIFIGRSTSRAPALFAMLAGFGPLRSTQIERLMGASRLGVRSMIASLSHAELIGQTRVGGGILFNAAPARLDYVAPPVAQSETNFSSAAIDEYEASMVAIDRLLTKKTDVPG